MSLLLALLMELGGLAAPYRDYAAVIELNHQYDPKGRHVFDQVIFWDHNPATGRLVVKAWIMCDEERHPLKRPDNLYHCRWTDEGIYRDVRSPIFRESWGHIDPEREDKKTWPEFLRSGLIRPRKSAEPTE